MQRLEVSGAVRPIYGSLGLKRLKVTSYPSVKSCIRYGKYKSVNSYGYVNAESLSILRIDAVCVNKLCEQNAENVGAKAGSPYIGRWASKEFSSMSVCLSVANPCRQ